MAVTLMLMLIVMVMTAMATTTMTRMIGRETIVEMRSCIMLSLMLNTCCIRVLPSA